MLHQVVINSRGMRDDLVRIFEDMGFVVPSGESKARTQLYSTRSSNSPANVMTLAGIKVIIPPNNE